ncbi:hypothetical protein BDP27DRAFT_1399330 [Rhodocollybia butyracea]|uniref:Uncharacterized protein n=1 Tax=Rhodocollybia butyracea TaxID=206335 RepID=A0A9P5Q4Q0_9AGAR|nr:hypothetical protein BDP27DRAFT_1399330 [Rhodocollybia butyracea]
MTSVSNFFSSPSKRNARSKNAPLQFLLPSKNDLQIIPEEENESRPSCSSWTTSSTCSTPELKKRRPISPYEIRIAKTPIQDSDDDFDTSLLSAPRPAPRPPCSPSSSPDSFCLTFTEGSFKFPHPPLPTPSSSDRRMGALSPLSSPSSDSSALPPTPTSSDDEFQLPPAPKFIARRVTIKPLTIVKHDALPSMFSKHSGESSPSDVESDGSDGEWYSREMSQAVTLRSIPTNLPTVKSESARPESMVGSVHVVSPVSSLSSAFPSPQLDPTYRRRRFTIPSRPPPPPPRDSLVPSPAVSDDDDLLVRPANPEPRRRPPPRMSIPADFVFPGEDGEDEDEVEEEDNVLTYYIEAESSSPSESTGSFYSQPSRIERFSISDLEEEFQFALDTDFDRPMMLPLSLPSTPLDLETDIANGLAELRLRKEADAPVDEVDESLPLVPSAFVTRSASLLARRQMRRNMTVSVPIALDWNLSEEEEAAADEAREEVIAQNSAPAPVEEVPVADPATDELSYEDHELHLETTGPGPALRSRWSSSTLSSIREEQQSRGWRTSKLRLYFGKKRAQSVSSSGGLLSPTTPTTPLKSKLDSQQKARNKKRGVVVVGPSSSVSASSNWSYGSSAPTQSPLPKVPSSAPATGPMSPYYNYESRSPASKRHRQAGSDEVMVIGYGHQPGGSGVRRRGSTSTTCSSAPGSGASDASSILSGSSSASSGLKRKPIPVEMFLRA